VFGGGVPPGSASVAEAIDADADLVESRLIDVGRCRRVHRGVPQKRLSGPQTRVLGYVVAEGMPEQVRMDMSRYPRSLGHVLDGAPDGLRRAWLLRVRDGRVTKLVLYFDPDNALADLGFAPEDG
jgi:hypothetical protein